MNRVTRCIVLLGAVLLFTNLVAQNRKIDSLKNCLVQNKKDTNEVIALYALAYQFEELGDYSTAMRYGKESVQLAEKLKYKSGCAAAYNHLGIISYYQGNFPEALNNYLISLKYCEAANDVLRKISCLINIGIIYAEHDDLVNAMKYYNEALPLAKQFKRKRQLCDLHINIGLVYYAQRKYNEALTYYKLALELARESNDQSGLVAIYNNMADVYVDESNYTDALRYSLEALDIAEQISFKEGISYSKNNIGKICIKQDKPIAAIENLKQALVVAKEIGSLSLLREGYNQLALAYSATGSFQQSLENYQLFILYRDSIYNDEKTKQLVQAQMQYEFDKKAAIADKELQNQKIIKTAIGIGSVLAICIMLLLYSKRKAKHNLQVNRLENKTLRAQLNPHFIFNALASIQRYMNEHPDLAQNYLAKFGKLMREVLENSEKEYISLEDELEMLKKYMDLEKLRVTHGFEYEINVADTVDAETVQIPPLIFQPIVENAIWHGVAQGSMPGRITIGVNINQEMLTIEIVNLNKGDLATESKVQNEGEKRKSFGLQIVRERLNLISKERRKKTSMQSYMLTNGMKVILELPI
jgi:tetratricopeptide (TPR) repeat protein